MMTLEPREGSLIQDLYWDGINLGYTYPEVDGYYVFEFKDNPSGGFWSEYILRGIADTLRDLNKDWDEKINEYFAEEARLKNRYKNISREEDYNLLLRSGMFWEFYPELTGTWQEDKLVMRLDDEVEPDVFL